jgi:hypothetical protein
MDIFESLKQNMEQLRDEIKLQSHLGKAEAKQEFEKLEKEFDGVLAKAKPFADEAEKTAGNTGAALKVAAEELIAGMDRIRKLIK